MPKKKMCLCEVKGLLWLAFVKSEEECKEEERMIREQFGEAECHAMNIPRRIVLACKEGA